jgi:hypothetical protein
MGLPGSWLLFTLCVLCQRMPLVLEDLDPAQGHADAAGSHVFGFMDIAIGLAAPVALLCPVVLLGLQSLGAGLRQLALQDR